MSWKASVSSKVGVLAGKPPGSKKTVRDVSGYVNGKLRNLGGLLYSNRAACPIGSYHTHRLSYTACIREYAALDGPGHEAATPLEVSTRLWLSCTPLEAGSRALMFARQS